MFTGSASTSCTPCPSGQWAGVQGLTACLDCSAPSTVEDQATACVPPHVSSSTGSHQSHSSSSTADNQPPSPSMVVTSLAILPAGFGGGSITNTTCRIQSDSYLGVYLLGSEITSISIDNCYGPSGFLMKVVGMIILADLRWSTYLYLCTFSRHPCCSHSSSWRVADWSVRVLLGISTCLAVLFVCFFVCFVCNLFAFINS